jgi:hypothetical protein
LAVLPTGNVGHPSAPARHRNPDTFFTELLWLYPRDAVGVIDAMGGALQVPLTRAEDLDPDASGGIPGYAALTIELS